MATPPEPQSSATSQDGTSGPDAHEQGFRIMLADSPLNGDDRGFEVIAGTISRMDPGQSPTDLLRGVSDDPAVWRALEKRLATIKRSADRSGNAYLEPSLIVTVRRTDDAPGLHAGADLYSHSVVPDPARSQGSPDAGPGQQTTGGEAERVRQARQAFDTGMTNLITLVRQWRLDTSAARRQAQAATAASDVTLTSNERTEARPSGMGAESTHALPSPETRTAAETPQPGAPALGTPAATATAQSGTASQIGYWIGVQLTRAVRRLQEAVLGDTHPAPAPTPSPNLSSSSGVRADTGPQTWHAPARPSAVARSESRVSAVLDSTAVRHAPERTSSAAQLRSGAAYDPAQSEQHLARYGGYYAPAATRTYSAASSQDTQVVDQERKKKRGRR